MKNIAHARETDLEPPGISGTMRFFYSPDVTFVITNVYRIRLPVMCSEKPAKAGTRLPKAIGIFNNETVSLIWNSDKQTYRLSYDNFELDAVYMHQ